VNEDQDQEQRCFVKSRCTANTGISRRRRAGEYTDKRSSKRCTTGSVDGAELGALLTPVPADGAELGALPTLGPAEGAELGEVHY
jgi:hypothetical protein